MAKYGILVDSSAGLTQEQTAAWNVFVAPLTLIHDDKQYEDQITMTYDDVKNVLSKHGVIKTSQPNIGTIINILNEMKKENYDHIFIVSLSSNLSGTYQAFNHACEDIGLENYTLLDTFSISGPIHSIIRIIKAAELENIDVQAINAKIDAIVDNTTTYVYPQDLKQLKASGRISSSAATLASLLKIKPVLRFENRGKSIEKFATARTEAKAFDIIVNDINTHNVTKELHDIYILEFEAKEVADKMISRLKEEYGDITIFRVPLPAAVATHAGIGTIAIQWTLKV